MSDYDYRPGGSLKLKGGVMDGGIVKKKKKSKSKSKDKDVPDTTSERVKELEALMREEKSTSASPSGSRHESPSASVSTDKKTAAEKRFEEVQKKRLAQRVAKLATSTHKDRVADFNNKLEALSEHHDIPKVGPG
ncbi:hypothetical protein EIP91_006164 [Steccherinum ochraceum]|uniref:DUF1754-domain-containing protein n=1 Tax=Steccherinum ochraceum TaxID=92696 RepID=A0A4R0R6F2_9APHY|nr:hypothetical protein EIP91_006164 [Steccherinum ochraceum]